MTYNVKYTDKNKTPIEISEDSINTSSTDITLFGRKKLDYGRDMNEALLHILENFACPEDSLNPGNPDLNSVTTVGSTTKRLLQTPVEGQCWYNKTQEVMFFWSGTAWTPLSMKGDIAVNWGTVCDGEQIPAPVGENGYIFPYSECVWIVSPASTSGEFEYILCYTDEDANVTMRYGTGGVDFRTGIASYMIIGLRGNINLGNPNIVDPPEPSATPGLTPTATATRTPTPTPTVTGTPGASVTPTRTPTPTVTPTITPATSATPTPTVTPTPGVTVTPTPSADFAGGDLIPFGDQEAEFYNASGSVTLGFAINGVNNSNATIGLEETSCGWRMETPFYDVCSSLWVDVGTTYGNEPGDWATNYWVYVDLGLTQHADIVYGTYNTWVQVGTGSQAWYMDSDPLGEGIGEYNNASISGTVYMTYSASPPSGGSEVGTLMGTFVAHAHIGDPP